MAELSEDEGDDEERLDRVEGGTDDIVVTEMVTWSPLVTLTR